jgi:hypothetical protein
MDDDEGPDLPSGLPAVLDGRLQLLGDGAPPSLQGLLLDLEVLRLGEEPLELGLEGIDPRDELP